MEKIFKILRKSNYDNEKTTIQDLVHIIRDSHRENLRLDSLHKLEKFKFDGDEIFTFLEDLALMDRNDKIRYITTKIIYKNYPDKSMNLIKWLLIHDSNYNFPIINFLESKRHNFNDMMNNCIENLQNREKMVADIINNKFLEFALSWKDYLDTINMFYDLNLKCFIINFKQSNDFVYLCRRATDPFHGFPIQVAPTTLKLYRSVRMPKNLRTITRFLKKFLCVKEEDLKIAILKRGRYNELPKFKIYSNSNEFISYLDFEANYKNGLIV